MALPVSSSGVALAYKDFLDVLVADERDRPRAAEVERLGVQVAFTNTIMDSENAKAELARAVLSFITQERAAGRAR